MGVGTLSMDEVAREVKAATPDGGIFARKQALVDRTGREVATPVERVEDPEEALVSDASQMEALVDEVLGELMGDADAIDEAKRAGHRVWSLPPRKSARLSIRGFVGECKVKQFRQAVREAVVGTRGGSQFSVVNNQQWNGTWVPCNFGRRRVIMDGEHYVQLLVEFIDLKNAPHIKYNSKGEFEEVDPDAGAGTLHPEIIKFMRELRSPQPQVDEVAVLREQVAKLTAMLDGLTAPASTAPPAEKPRK